MSTDNGNKTPLDPKARPNKDADLLDEDAIEQRLAELEQKSEEAFRPRGTNILDEDDEQSIDVRPLTDDDPWAD